MNDLLQLKGTFEQKANTSKPGAEELPAGADVDVAHLEKLKKDLEDLLLYWSTEKILNGALISIYYKTVVAKSRRVSATLAKGKDKANSSVVGAKFFNDNGIKKHVITHYVGLDVLEETINRYKKSIDIVRDVFNGKVTCDDIKKLNRGGDIYDNLSLSRTIFGKIIVDANYIEKFSVSVPEEKINEDAIITIYKTDIDSIQLMEKIGISILPGRIIDNTTMLLNPDQVAILMQKAPYLVSMAVSDLSKITKSDFATCDELSIVSIPKPNNQPIIGVIDTMFDKNVYFSEWVEFKNMVDGSIELSSEDYFHGTAVSSIIVDGPTLNHILDDGCGRFRVRHFGVTTSKSFSSFTILRTIKEVISSNKDIKVWNLSLGSAMEINPNFISPEAAILDKIQSENDVVFIISGTNKKDGEKEKKIGAPADSINSLVVNSVKYDNTPAEYSREGPVLSFFVKPDISYYGGDEKNKIKVRTSKGESLVCGTSFAAPWIARKMAYLINIIGLSREVAKALIIDSATGWKTQTISPALLGFGVVPVKINDILKSPNDEIRFILSGVSEKYDAYTYNLPVPTYNNYHPFVAKATMCYFPYCSRNQGVDYTNTEFDISFGRVNPDRKIKPINNNYQSSDSIYTYEEDARKFYRKWDNVKHIREVVSNNKPKKVYNGMWGVSIKKKERLDEKWGNGIKFGIVITLKEINGVNRIEDFIQQCALRGWLVNRINIENRIDIYNIAEETIDFDDFN